MDLAFDSAASALDDLLRGICESLQLPAYRLRLAEERYQALASVLEAESSPFAQYAPRIYPQGSMRLGTTVKPLSGPHDLDFVVELNLNPDCLAPGDLIDILYSHLRQHGTYRGMVTRKRRCVRLSYADEFYLDILPACTDHRAGGTCIVVPDRSLDAWVPSNPIGYAGWFRDRARLTSRPVLAEAERLPAQIPADEKRPLQLTVQLIKRWRDNFFDAAGRAPVSIVLTTLAAGHYKGEASIAGALASIADGVVKEIERARQARWRVVVLNPSNPKEDLSESWDGDAEAYSAFAHGMAALHEAWMALLSDPAKAHATLFRLFGEEPFKAALAAQARRVQGARQVGALGVSSAGALINSAGSVRRIRPNTFYGA
ncbi:MAG: nucleotidyltransferase domain-containing protein [Candidatus Acidiferrales bacterium]